MFKFGCLPSQFRSPVSNQSYPKLSFPSPPQTQTSDTTALWQYSSFHSPIESKKVEHKQKQQCSEIISHLFFFTKRKKNLKISQCGKWKYGQEPTSFCWPSFVFHWVALFQPVSRMITKRSPLMGREGSSYLAPFTTPEAPLR